MTGPFFRVINPAAGGVLVADRMAPGIYYRGRATLVETVQPWGTVGSLAGRQAGYSHYSYVSTTPVFPAVQLRNGCVVAHPSTYGVHRVGDTWHVWVYCSNSTVDTDGFADQEAPEVYMFGPLNVSSVSGVGLRLRDDAGNLTHAYTDLGPAPMWFRNRLAESGSSVDTSTPRSIASMTKPAAVGWPRHTKYQDEWPNSATLRRYEWVYGWRWSAGTPGQVALVEVKTFQNRDPDAGPPGGSNVTVTTPVASDTLVFDADGFA